MDSPIIAPMTGYAYYLALQHIKSQRDKGTMIISFEIYDLKQGFYVAFEVPFRATTLARILTIPTARNIHIV